MVSAEAPPVFWPIIDPCISVLSYLAVALLQRSTLQERDIIAMLLIALLTFPGTVPFRRPPALVALHIVLRSTWVLLIILAIGTIASDPPYFEPVQMLTWFAFAVTSLLVAHGSWHWLKPRLGLQRRRERAVIVGVNAVGRRLARALESDADDAHAPQVLGFFDDRSPERTGLGASQGHLGDFGAVAGLVQSRKVSIIYITLPMSPQPRLVNMLRELQDTTATVCFVPDIYLGDVIQGGVSIVAGMPTLAMCDTPLRGHASMLKRAVDLTGTIAALPLLLPLMAVIALAIRVTSPGPVIFKQRRYGMGGEEITVLKFRTMRVTEDGDRTYRQVTRDDDRVTAVGRILRKTSLDELPQFLNVLEGTMSLVGPRPHALAVNEQFRRLIPGYMVRHKVKPGITGWAQVNGARGGDDLEAMRKRTEYDLQYLRSWSIALDLAIVGKTVLMLLRGDKNAY